MRVTGRACDKVAQVALIHHLSRSTRADPDQKGPLTCLCRRHNAPCTTNVSQPTLSCCYPPTSCCSVTCCRSAPCIIRFPQVVRRTSFACTDRSPCFLWTLSRTFTTARLPCFALCWLSHSPSREPTPGTGGAVYMCTLLHPQRPVRTRSNQYHGYGSFPSVQYLPELVHRARAQTQFQPPR